jgi:hypothetical protein
MQMKNQAQTIEKASDERKEGDIGVATASRSAVHQGRPLWLELFKTALPSRASDTKDVTDMVCCSPHQAVIVIDTWAITETVYKGKIRPLGKTDGSLTDVPPGYAASGQPANYQDLADMVAGTSSFHGRSSHTSSIVTRARASSQSSRL